MLNFVELAMHWMEKKQSMMGYLLIDWKGMCCRVLLMNYSMYLLNSQRAVQEDASYHVLVLAWVEYLVADYLDEMSDCWSFLHHRY